MSVAGVNKANAMSITKHLKTSGAIRQLDRFGGSVTVGGVRDAYQVIHVTAHDYRRQ